MAQKTVLEILLAAGVVTEQQISECSTISKESGQLVDRCLLEKKYITPLDFARAYAEYANLPLIEDITEPMADLGLLAKIPLKFLRANLVMPIVKDGTTMIVTANPTNFQPLDELNLLLGGGLQYAVASESAIIDAINKYYPLEGAKQMIEELGAEQEELEPSVAFEDIEEKDILAMASEAPIIKLVNHILFQAVKRGASDIHIEPFEKELRVRYRIDGIMYEAMKPPKRIQGALVSRIKIMASMNIAEKRLPQDGRIQIKVADKTFDIRVSILPVSFGECIVMRLLDKTKSFTKLTDMGMDERDFKLVMEGIQSPNGIIYVTGPTGSGKTTTLYSILSELNTPEVNIVTVEDPVEYQVAGINQVQVRDKVGLTFAVALRSILRQDPDIVMIGETRDQETAQIAVQAALTGHLVLSTLHTNSAAASITRLIDMGVEPFLIASSVELIIAQRLVRKLCDNCKQAYQPDPALLARLGLKPDELKGKTIYKAVGCDECLQTGYRGRIAIFEVMPMTEKIAQLTMQRADASQIRKQAREEGMTFLVQDGVRKILMGLTTIEEVLAVATMEYSVGEGE
jgi:general secretion pathway protein E